MRIEEIIKEAFDRGWNASHECATNFDYQNSLNGFLYEIETEIKNFQQFENIQTDLKKHTDANNFLVGATYRGDELRQHTGIYGLVSLGRGRKLGKVVCPFCNTAVDCYLWSISGSGKKCKCGAVLYRTTALRTRT